jgi:hypothetical protein
MQVPPSEDRESWNISQYSESQTTLMAVSILSCTIKDAQALKATEICPKPSGKGVDWLGMIRAPMFWSELPSTTPW